MSAAAVAFPSPKLLLCALDESLTLELKQVLGGFDSQSLPDLPNDLDACLRALRDSGALAVFGPAGPAALLKRLLSAAQQAKMPVIVITRTPDVREWLDAMEAGAADYAAPPFDQDQLRWMLGATLR